MTEKSTPEGVSQNSTYEHAMSSLFEKRLGFVARRLILTKDIKELTAPFALEHKGAIRQKQSALSGLIKAANAGDGRGATEAVHDYVASATDAATVNKQIADATRVQRAERGRINRYNAKADMFALGYAAVEGHEITASSPTQEEIKGMNLNARVIRDVAIDNATKQKSKKA